jgi:nucleoside-diphosphate-sugar epimerase
MKCILLTGVAGFIGHKTGENLLQKGYAVVGVDNMNDYYDVRLKEYRLKKLMDHRNFKFYHLDIEDFEGLQVVFKENRFDGVINLAARAGVRYSMENPFIYVRTNSLGTLNLLEHCKTYEIDKFVLASTSSLYAGQPMPFNEDLAVNEPISPYAASKKGAETMAYTYHYLYDIDVTIVRYFTVYGPAGRPDMSIFRFIKWIDEKTPVEIFGDGTQSRDFTYVDDIAEGTVRAYEVKTGHKIINLGGNRPYELNYAIKLIEECLGTRAEKSFKPFHKADLKATWADITKAQEILNWEPTVPLTEGIKNTVEWYLDNKNWIKDISIPS